MKKVTFFLSNSLNEELVISVEPEGECVVLASGDTIEIEGKVGVDEIDIGINLVRDQKGFFAILHRDVLDYTVKKS